MKTVCNHCGMESDKPDICTWCGKDIGGTPGRAKAADAKGKAPAAPGGKAAAPAARPSPLGRKVPKAADKKAGVPAWVYYAVPLGVIIVGLVAWSVLKARAASAPPKEPGDWTPIKSQNGNISMQVPANWKWRTSGSSGTFEKVVVQCGDMCFLSIEGTQGKGAMGDITGAAARASASPEGGEMSLDRKPEGRLHSMLADLELKKDPSYKEEGEMQPAAFGGLPAAGSQYTTVKRAGLFKVKLKGIRMTAPGGDYGWDIRIVAPEKSFDQFAPIAVKMLASVQLTK